LHFLQDAHDRDWNYAIHTYYGLTDVASLERRWSDWVMAGSPELGTPRGQMVAQADANGRQPVIRSQSPDAASEAAEPPAPAARVARPIARNDEFAAPAAIAAPSPIDRRALSVRKQEQQRPSNGAWNSDAPEQSDASREAALRREGRQRLLDAGWQPVANPGSNSDVAPVSPAVDARSQSNPEDRSATESAARRRFRTAKERHAVEAETSNKSATQIEEMATHVTERDLSEAQTPFHVEN
jgi:hypothetical protein